MTEEVEHIEETKEVQEQPDLESKEPKRKVKKVPPRRRKAKREKESPVIKAIRLAVETGKLSFGYRSSMKNVKKGEPKLLILSNNLPELHSNEILHFTSESKVPVYTFDGNAKQLGAICGKPFLVSVISIMDAGNSDILSLVKTK